MKLKPLHDRVVVKPSESEDKTKSGIVLPETAQEKPQKGTVVAAGEGKLDRDNKRVPLGVKKGDKIIYSKYGGTDIKVNGDELLILREDDILAIFKD